MSTTAQDTPLPGTTAQEAAEALSELAAAAPAPAAPAPANDREYTLFEEARQDTWTQIGKVEARSQEAALESLGEQKLVAAQKEGKRFMAIPSRFAVPRKPKVDTVTTVAFE